jgi:alkylation response protein AidB-like acyl-CoA dehydrogenase
MGDLPYERLIIGVMALAAMEGAYEATLDYVRERQVFGKPLAEQQNTRFKLAEIATQIKVGRAFIDQCVRQLLAGTLDTATASMAKLWAPRRRAASSTNACSCSAAMATWTNTSSAACTPMRGCSASTGAPARS